MILLYSPTIPERLTFIAEFVIRQILGGEVDFTDDIDRFASSALPRINYSTSLIEGTFHISPSGLLDESGIIPFRPETGRQNDLNFLFPTTQGDLPFDLFSAAFYMITRYEEYYSQATDRWKRYMCEDSISYDMGWIETPIVDHWALFFKDSIDRFFDRTIEWKTPPFRFISTIDVDYPYAYRSKSILLHLLRVLNDLIRFNIRAIKQRIRVLLMKEEDPYFVFDDINRWHEEAGLDVCYFIHVGPYGRHDRKTIYPTVLYYLKLKEMAETNPIGSHPSYFATFRRRATEFEINKLSRITGKPVTANRQHYLRFRLPDTYRMLSQLGIKEDYSMGYASRYGFRAGTCHPHQFFDVEQNIAHPLTIHPTIVMDTTLNKYMHLSPEVSLEHIREMVEACKQVNGEFVLLFHNSSMADMFGWTGWKNTFLTILNENKR